MRAAILDAESLGPDLDHTRLEACVDAWDWYARTAPEEVAARIAPAAVVVTNKVALDAHAFAAAPHLRLVCVAATGVNNIDLDAAAHHGVTVCNATGYATPAVVQHTFALMLALATRLEAYHHAVRAGAWSRAPHFCLLDYPIQELAGATLGIVGHGELGRAVAALGRALGMDVQIAARPGSATAPPDRVAFPELLARADVLSLHCPLTEATQGLIDGRALAAMKPTGLLINTARGGLVDAPALAGALQRGDIAGAGIDVLEREPPPRNHPLLAEAIPNLIVTPHCAWGTGAARQRLVTQIAANIEAFRAGAPRNVVAQPTPQE